MRIERLARWHWIAIGVGVGLLLGWWWGHVSEAGGLDSSGTIGAADFEKDLLAQPLEGHPWVRHVTIHQVDGKEIVTLESLRPDPRDPHPLNRRMYHYLQMPLHAHRPYVPALPYETNLTVDVRVDLVSDSGSINGFEARNFDLVGWSKAAANGADPRRGATMGLSLRAADYELSVLLDGDDEKLDVFGNLALKFNNHLLAPLNRVNGGMWQTKIPRDYFAAGAQQTLSFARRDRPLHIRQVRLLDPSYSVANYLGYLRQKHPEISYSSAWWDRSLVWYSVWAAGGALVIGGIWPSLLKLLVGAGFGRPQPEDNYDLSRFGNEKRELVPARRALDDQALVELNESLTRQLGQDACEGSPAACAATTAPSPKPLSAVGSDAPAPAAAELEKPIEYRGEYYPVARSSGAEDS